MGGQSNPNYHVTTNVTSYYEVIKSLNPSLVIIVIFTIEQLSLYWAINFDGSIKGNLTC